MNRLVMTCVLAPALATAALARPPVQQPSMARDAAQPVCPRDAAPIPPALAAWSARRAMTAAVDPATLSGAMLTPGNAVDLALAPTPRVAYALRPAHPGGSVSHGGMVAVTIAAAGTYRVAIGSAAWIDLVTQGRSLESVGHGHGPACSGIRKMVDFALEPGHYILEIAGNGTATLPVMITRLP